MKIGQTIHFFDLVVIFPLNFFSESETEGISSSTSTSGKMSANQELASLVQRLEAVATRLEKTQPGGSNAEGRPY